MSRLAASFSSRRRYERLQRMGRVLQRPVARGGKLRHLPGPLAAWTRSRDLSALPQQTFREWWRARPPRAAP
jgi:L-lactate dehydrogenase complex protein LldF